ncbi:MAG: sensor histidine kinase [Mediterraneibacter sp.]
MLNSLYKKLYILFTVSVMLIITFVISFAVVSAVSTDRTNESTMFQRMTTLLIYQLENTPSDMENTIRSYEEKYHLYAVIENTEGQEIYQSDFAFPAQTDILLEDISEQNSQQQIVPEGEEDGTVTSQGGIYEITGTEQNCYYAIPASIAAAGQYEYQAVFIYPVSDLKTILVRLLPRYSAAWMLALAGVLVIMRFLLRKAFMPTERILKSQKDFVATASHELKSPLAVMIANTDSLLDNRSLDETAKQAAGTIESECMRLSRLVKDMLTLASSDAKAWTLHKSEVDIDTLLITLYETYEQTCLKNGIELKLELSEDTYPALTTDKDRLFQILCIFMDNAIQHSENNSLIEIKAVPRGKQISFSIADHGQGISAEDKKYIFDRFYSGDKSHTNKANFGLGLSIAEELTKMLKGRIQVSDTPGGGATFTILL